MAESRFHLVDLLAVHLRAPLEVPESRGALALLKHLADEPSGPMLYVLWERCRVELHEQFPWLARIEVPEHIAIYDWAKLWAWVDMLGRRHGHHHIVAERALNFPGIEPVTAEEAQEIEQELLRHGVTPERVAPTKDNRGHVRLTFVDIRTLIAQIDQSEECHGTA